MHESNQTGNPIIKHTYTADPSVIVHEGKVFLHTGHDEAPPGVYKYIMNKWLCFSSEDLVNWTEHPSPLKATDFSWAKGNAYASKVIERDGRFFWYVAVAHASIPGNAIGVAVAPHPAGPYTDAKGSAVVTHSDLFAGGDNFDPGVLIDDDGQAWLFWGKKVCYYAMLHSNMTELTGEIKTISLPDFIEGIHLHKRNGWYYLSYGYGTPEKVAYAMSRHIDGPWEFKGILNELAGNCETNRPAIIDFKGKSFFFYHNGALKDGGSHRRSVCVDPLYYNADGTMNRVVMSSEGVGGNVGC